jgi:DnaJ-class molecular chaperone
MSDKEEQPKPPPAKCGSCMGARGQWVTQNGNKPAQQVWVQCGTCNGHGVV